MKIILVAICYLALCSPAFAAERKVVVVPLNSRQAVFASEGIDMSCSLEMSPGYTSGGCIFYTVPPGKVLVVEFISGDLRLPVGQQANMRTTLFDASGGGVHHTLYLRYQKPYLTRNMYIVSQQVKLYIDEKHKIGIQAGRTDSSSSAFGDFYLSGYLVDKK